METAASKPEALDNPDARDDEEENELWFLEDLENTPMYVDDDDYDPYTILFRLLGL